MKQASGVAQTKWGPNLKKMGGKKFGQRAGMGGENMGWKLQNKSKGNKTTGKS